MIRFAIALSLILAATPPHAADEHGHAEEDHAHAEDDAHLFELGGFEVLHPWTRATKADEALVFMELINEGGDPVSIIGAETGAAETAALVGFQMSGGEGSYVPLDPVPVQPGREMDLSPDGLAIRLTGLRTDLAEGQHFDLTLITSNGKLEIEASVEAADATQHSHAGHAH